MTRREFPKQIKAHAFQRANGYCEKCTAFLSVGKFHYDHILPDALGGEPTLDNCQVLCSACHGEKTAKSDVPRIAKTNRQKARHIGAKAPSRNPLPGGRNSKWKRTMSGKVVPR